MLPILFLAAAATSVPDQATRAIEIDGQTIDPSAPFQKQASENSVIVVREGKSIVVLRIFEAEKSQLVLQAERDGLKYHALRYTAYHYRGPAAMIPKKHQRVGIIVYASTCSTDKECADAVKRIQSARIESKSDGHIWNVIAEIHDTKLAAERDLDHRAIVSRDVNGKPFRAQSPLSVGQHSNTTTSILLR